MSACKPTKIITNEPTENNSKNPKVLVKRMNAASLDFQWFSGKAKIKYIDMTQNRSVRTSIAIRRDSMIWMSVSLFGIEGVRVKILPDSVHIINRLEKQYIVKPLSLIEEQFNLPADFSAIQAMLVGNPVIYKESEFTVQIEESQYILQTEKPVKTAYTINKSTYQLNNLLIKDEKNQTMDMSFQEYAPADEKRNFSFLRDILLTSPGQGAKKSASVNMAFSKAVFDVPKKMSFRVPKSYKRMK